MSEESIYWQQITRRRLSRRAVLRTGALVGIGLAAGGSVLGCGQPQSKAGTTPGAGEQPQTGGIMTYRTAGDPPNFDLMSNSTYMVLHTMMPIYNNLVQYDPLNPDKVVGDLAEKWEVSPDGKAYTFYLVKGVKFHDGKPCTSADVKYTFDMVREPPKGVVSPRKGSLAAVDGIETPDEYTVRFVLKRPAPSLLLNLAQGWMGVFPKHILQEKGSMQKDAIGTGPFKLKEYNRGVSVELVRNPDYHVKGRPYMDGIKIFIIPDPGTALASLRTGQLDYAYGNDLNADEVDKIAKESGGKVTFQSRPGYGFATLSVNGKRKPWDDPRVVQALSLAVDRNEAVKVIHQGYAAVGGFMPAGSPWGLPPDELAKIPGYGKDTAANIAEAKKLLAQAGLTSGLSTTMLTRKGVTYEALSVFLKDQLAKVGIDAKLDVQETAAAYDVLNNRTFDLAPWSHSIAVDDPDGVFAEFYTCDAERNYAGLCSKEVDDLFEKQSQTLNEEERRKLVRQMEKAALLTYSKIILDWSTRYVGLAARVRNHLMHPSLYNNQRFQDVWLAKS